MLGWPMLCLALLAVYVAVVLAMSHLLVAISY